MIFNYKINEDMNLIDYLNSFHLSKTKIHNLFIDKSIKVNNNECNRKQSLY